MAISNDASTGMIAGSTGSTILSQIQLATLPNEQGLNTSLLSKTSPFLRIMQEKAKRAGGDSIRVQLRYDRNNTQWYSGFDTLSARRSGPTNAQTSVGDDAATNPGPQQWGSAVYRWRNLAVNVAISEDQLVENASMNISDLMGISKVENIPARDRHTIFNIFGKEVELATEDMSDALASALMRRGADTASEHGGAAPAGITANADGQGGSIHSIFDILSPHVSLGGHSSGAFGTFADDGLLATYQLAADGGTATSSTEKWVSRFYFADTADDSPGGSGYIAGDLTAKILGLALHDTAQGGTDSVDYVFVSPRIYVALEQDLQGQVRRDEYMTDLGFRQNMEWGAFGTTIMADPYMPSTDVIGINTNHTWLNVHSALDQQFTGFKTKTDAATIEGQLKVKAQLVSDDRAKNFWIRGVTRYNDVAI